MICQIKHVDIWGSLVNIQKEKCGEILTMWCPQTIAKLVNISTRTMVDGSITIVGWGYKPTHLIRGPHLPSGKRLQKQRTQHGTSPCSMGQLTISTMFNSCVFFRCIWIYINNLMYSPSMSTYDTTMIYKSGETQGMPYFWIAMTLN